MLAALGMAALSAGGSLLSGIGKSQASAKQARLQMIADYEARRLNEEQQRMVMDEGRRLGQELLTIPEERGSWVDVDGMMAAAERAGFNPVTFLNAGGMQAYTMGWTKGHNAADAYKMQLPQMLVSSPSQVPQQHSMLEAFGGALSAGASAFGTQYRADQSYDVQMARVMAAGAMQGMGISSGNGLSTALSYGGGGGGFAGSATPSRGLSDLPYPQNWKPGDVEVTNPFRTWAIDSTTSDAEAYETRYGDLAQELFGASNLFQDAVRAATGKTLKDWGIAAGMNIGDYTTKSDNSYIGTISRWWNSPDSLPNRKLPGFSGSATGYMPFPGANAY